MELGERERQRERMFVLCPAASAALAVAVAAARWFIRRSFKLFSVAIKMSRISPQEFYFVKSNTFIPKKS